MLHCDRFKVGFALPVNKIGIKYLKRIKQSWKAPCCEQGESDHLKVSLEANKNFSIQKTLNLLTNTDSCTDTIKKF